MNPAGKRDGLSDVCRAQFVAMMRSFHVKIGRAALLRSPNQAARQRRPTSQMESESWREIRWISK
jgi:hypothetical protein